jgi:hypothetical protein
VREPALVVVGEKKIEGCMMLRCLILPHCGRHYEFDPATVDTESLAANLADLAKRWSRKPATKHPRQA